MILLGVLAGLTGGVVIGSLQLARRTSTAYERLERASSVPDAVVLAVGGADVAERIVQLPEVESSWITSTGVGRVGVEAVRYAGVLAGVEPPPPGLFTPIIMRGRDVDPAAADEMVISEHMAELTGFGVGDSVGFDFLTTEEFTRFDIGFGEPDGPELRMRIVGVMRVSIDEGTNAIESYSTPALAARLAEGDADVFPTTLVRLRDGLDSLPAFQRSLDEMEGDLEPQAGGEEFGGIEVQVPSRQRSVVAVTSRVQVAGILVFAGIAAVAGVLGVALALRRHFLATIELDLLGLAALGCSRRDVRLARLITAIPFVAVGTLVAIGVAIVLGVLEPIGSMATREPHPGWHVNVVFVVVGALVVPVALTLVAWIVGPDRTREAQRAPGRPSALVEQLARAGAPPTAVVGTRLALEPGRGRTAVPVRSTLAGVAVGLVGLVAVTVFAASLYRALDTPARWGWVADALLVDVNRDVRDRVQSDPRVDAASLVDEVLVDVEGRNASAEAFADEKGPGAISWTIVDGRPPGRGEVLLGARLARELDMEVGDRASFRGDDGREVDLEVVGIGVGPNLSNQQFGAGVMVAPEDVPRVGRTQPFVGASLRFAPGVDADAVAAEYGTEIETFRPQRPPDVDNLAQLGALPELLAGFLVVVGLAVLAHLLVTTARRRRRDLDTLRAVGFVPRQARSVIAIVALITVGVGLVVGVPLGIAAGRLGWRFTAHAVYIAEDPRVPGVVLVLLVAAALLAAVLAAIWPAWRAADGPVAAGLREE